MKRSFLITGCLWVVLILGSTAWGFQTAQQPELPNFDQRQAVTEKEWHQRKNAAVTQLQENLRHSRVDFDAITGSPRWVRSQNGFLSGQTGKGSGFSSQAVAGLSAADPHRAAKAFLNEHRPLFGHGAEILAEMRVKRDYVGKHNGLRTTVWEQRRDGLAVWGGTLIAQTTQAGELVTISSGLVAEPAPAAKGKNQLAFQTGPAVDARQAAALMGRNLGEKDAVKEDFLFWESEPGAEQRQRFHSAKFPGETAARLVWLPLDEKSLQLCWDVILTSPSRGEMFQGLVDAEKGEVLVRRNLTHYLSDATYRVFTSDSPSPFSPGHAVPWSDQPPVTSRSLVTLSALQTNASPNGWIDDGVNETRGNNVEAQLDRNNNNFPDLPRPQGSPSRVFDFPLDLNQDPTVAANQSAAVVQLFYWCNWMHDKLYDLGFTEEAGNFQMDNFGRGGVGGDPVQADAQDGAGFNNANFATPPDGFSGRMQMFIFSGPSPHRDGDFDAEVILHEYTHGLSQRLVGGGEGADALQSAGLGEGWSDFYALALLSEPTDDVNGNYPFAAYITHRLATPSGPLTNNYYFGIRRYPYSTVLTNNPLTFKDIDPAQALSHTAPRSPADTGSADEVHNQGEVWGSALWEMRANLIGKYGYATGNQLALQLTTDGMKLTPPNPNFLQARDAILLADQVNNGGTNYWDLWAAFAKRGMGFFASSPASSTTAGVVESFALPDDLFLTPNQGLVSSGPLGGPFWPNQQGYAITNFGTNLLAWSFQTSANWLNLSLSNGVLMADAGTNVTASLNTAVVNGLSGGLYTNRLVFSNHVTGITQTRLFILRVNQPDFYTELFENGDRDVEGQMFTFTTNGSTSFYAVCREAATNFPVDPTGGTVLPLADDTNAAIVASSNVSVYDTRSQVLFVGSNGYLTFGAGDSTFTPSASAHFNRPRISGLFRDLDPGTNGGGVISWKQTTNGVAVTYQNVPLYGTEAGNTFQIYLGFDGTIRLTYLQLATRNGIVGLSAGTGIPPAFFESDFSVLAECAPPLTVILPGSVSEGNGTLVGAGQVTIPLPLATNLPITFYTSDASEISAPTAVELPAGATNVFFDLPIVDDVDLDGTQSAIITAVAPHYLSGQASVLVFDNETGILTVELPPYVTEGDGATTWTVTANEPPTADILVSLQSSDPTEIMVPVSVVLPAGQTSVVANLTVVNDASIDGEQTVNITAQVTNWTSGVGQLIVRDNENTNLTLLLPASVREGHGVWPLAGLARISGTLPTNLVMALASDDLTEITVPATVTIPAGKTAAAFDLIVMDDVLLDGNQNVPVRINATAFAEGAASVTVTDNESPLAPTNPFPAHLSANNPVNVDLAWSHGFGEGLEQMTNGNFEAGDLTGWAWVAGTNDQFLISTAPAIPFAGNFAARAKNSGVQELYQDVAIPTNAVSVTVSWADRWQNGAAVFDSNQRFQVFLRNTNHVLLQSLFTTKTDDSLFQDWTERSFDLASYQGQTVRLSFVVTSTTGDLDVQLDNVSLRAATSPATTYDVYFGPFANPDFNELLGSTTGTSLALPPLAPLGTYYWQVISYRLGETVGPVWQFRVSPALSISDANVVEGETGTTNIALTLTLDAPNNQPVVVNFATAHGTAGSDDYVASNGVVTLAPGQTNQTLFFTVNGDTAYESNETFFVNLSATNAAQGDFQAVVTIVNDDPLLAPIANKTVNENALLTFAANATFLGQATSHFLTGFEEYPTNSASGSVLFNNPRTSSTTAAFLGSTHGSVITRLFPAGHAGSNVLRAYWDFNSTNNPWLRLVTSGTATLPNPTIDFRQVLQFDIYTDRTLRLGLGLRETGTTNAIGSNGGTTGTIEFVGVTNLSSTTPNPARTITASNWQTVNFNLPYESATAFIGGSSTGNGVLHSATGLGVLEHLALAPVTGAAAAAYNIYLDNFTLIYSNALSFSLSNAPSGASIHPATGIFTWTPTEAQGPGVYTMTIHVTDLAYPTTTSSQTFSVTVNEVNTKPTLSFIPAKTITEGAWLIVTNFATDADIPSQTLTYSLNAGFPDGASIDPVTGIFTWMPSETQGPSTNSLIVRVTDSGNPSLSDTRTLAITVLESNRPPVLPALSNRTVTYGTPISVSLAATDPDWPANALSYGLLSTPPEGASLHPGTGLFTWTPHDLQAPSTNLFTVSVSDNGFPPLTNTVDFTIRVVIEPIIQSVTVSGDNLTLIWSSIDGQTYRVQTASNLTDSVWVDVPGDVTAIGPTATKEEALDATSVRFYRVQMVP